jgi:hypothetical protein
MTNMKQIGWFVVGYDGNSGNHLIDENDGNRRNFPIFMKNEKDVGYWGNRGYTIIPALISIEDKEEYTAEKKDNDTGVNYVR